MLLGILSPSLYAIDIEVEALFSNAAMLSIDGRSQLLRKGQVSSEGVRLIDANSREAVVEYQGEKQTLFLSNRIGSTFKTAEKAQVHITMTENRQYIAHGSVNGRAARFIVDTGANVVAINSKMARSLGISLEGGIKMRTATASDNVMSTAVNIKEIQVGDIKQNNVVAVVIDGDHPSDILLGMSFLQHVEISENAGLMILTSKL